MPDAEKFNRLAVQRAVVALGLLREALDLEDALLVADVALHVADLRAFVDGPAADWLALAVATGVITEDTQ